MWLAILVLVRMGPRGHVEAVELEPRAPAARAGADERAGADGVAVERA